MNTAFARLGDIDWGALAWTEFWQVTLVAAVALLVVRMFCRRRPYLAYALLMLVVVKCLVPPLWSSRAGVFSWMQLSQTQPPATAPALEPNAYETPFTDTTTFAEPPASFEQPLPDPRPVTTAAPTFALPSWSTLLVGLWATGAVVCALVIGVGWFRQYRAIRRRCTAASGDVVELATQLAKQLGLRRQPRLWVSQCKHDEPAFGPLCFGVLRPTVVLPETLVTGSSHDALTPILAHELVHLGRGDTLAAVLQVWATALWWFHPFVWLTSRQLSRQREKCCDQAVVALTNCAPETYAQGVLNVLRHANNMQPMYLASGIRPVDVTGQRLEAIMSPGAKLRKRTPWFCWAVLMVGAIVLLPGRGFVHGADEVTVPANATPRLQRVRAQETSSNWLKLIGVALHSYHSVNGHFPAAASCGADGKPLLSWRVHLLPYLEREDLYKRFHLDEPWDSPHNRKLIAEMPVVFRSPNTHSEPGKTTYLALVGEDAIFGIQENGPDQPTVYREGPSYRDIEDGTSATATLVEVPDKLAVEWTRPRDFRIVPKHPSKGLFAQGEQYAMVLFADGSRHLISNTISDQLMLAICSKDGHEVVDMSSIKSAQQFSPSDAQESNREKKPAVDVSRNNLKQIGLALHNFYDAHGHFPGTANRDADGNALLSWRVHVLPFLGEQELYQRFRLDEPWDSPHNKALLAEMPDVFRSRVTDSAPEKTNFLGVAGEHGIFSTSDGAKLREIRDGTSNTVMVAEVSDELAVEWTRPEDFNYDPEQPDKGLFDPAKHDAVLVFGDGHVHRLQETVPDELLLAILTMDQQEIVDWSAIDPAQRLRRGDAEESNVQDKESP